MKRKKKLVQPAPPPKITGEYRYSENYHIRLPWYSYSDRGSALRSEEQPYTDLYFTPEQLREIHTVVCALLAKPRPVMPK